MAVTRQWDETTPVGAATQASQIDDLFRSLKADIRERLEQTHNNFAAGPGGIVTIKPELIVAPDPGIINGKVMGISHAAFTPMTGTIASRTEDYMESTSGGGTFIAPVILPPGVTIVRMEPWMDRNNIAASNCTMALKRNVAGVLSFINSISSNVNGLNAYDGGSLNVVHATNEVLYLVFTTPSAVAGGRVHFVYLRYNTPSSQNTL